MTQKSTSSEFQRRALKVGLINTLPLFVIALWLMNRFGGNAAEQIHPMFAPSAQFDWLFYACIAVVVVSELWLIMGIVRRGKGPKDVGF